MRNAITSCAVVALAISGCGPREPEEPVVLFTRHYLEPIYQEDLPSAREIGAPLELAATPGEYEPASFAVHAFRSLEKVTVGRGDLVCGDEVL
ncbi:MAG: hypothetical protein JSV80_05165, partial [Acidobacteriota bacterium]